MNLDSPFFLWSFLLKCGGLGFQMFFAHPSEPTPSSTFRVLSTVWRTSSSDTFVQIGSHSDGDRFIPVLFFRLRQLPVSSRPLLSDRDSSAEVAPCSASESSDASELILETSLAAAVRVGNAALCSPVLLSARTHRRPLMAMEPRADLLLRWNPGQTAWGHNGTCGNPINTREPSGDRAIHGNPSKTGEKTGTQGRPRGNPG